MFERGGDTTPADAACTELQSTQAIIVILEQLFVTPPALSVLDLSVSAAGREYAGSRVTEKWEVDSVL